jgi:hypothetical protein
MSRPEPLARVAILWRGRPGDEAPKREDNRLRAIFDEFEAQGASTDPLVFSEEAADDVRRRIASLDAVLTWVDPIVRGRDRSVLDAMLREASAAGIYVSAHPDVILKMGTKDVLFRTSRMGWGSDTHIVRSLDELRTQFPARLRAGPRVLKQNRGSGGDGVWKVELVNVSPGPGGVTVRVLHALRGSRVETLPLNAFIDRCALYFEAFAGSGCIIDQPYQARLGEGMIRCYLSHDRVVGFGHQFVTALLPPPEGTDESPLPPPRYYFGPEKPEFQDLKAKLESGWIAEMQRLCDVATGDLPAIWDADFLLGPRTDSGEDTYVLCEINVSGVFPIPDESVAPLAAAANQSAVDARRKRAT